MFCVIRLEKNDKMRNYETGRGRAKIENDLSRLVLWVPVGSLRIATVVKKNE
jgi:hypothetical protein